MELQLKKTSIEGFEKVFAYTARREETTDAVVPDTLPDVSQILCATGNVLIRSKDVDGGRLRIEANLPIRVVFVPEEGNGLGCMDVNLPFSFSVEDARIPEDGLCLTELSIASMDAKILNPRKVSVRAEIVISLDCWKETSIEFQAAPEEPMQGLNTLVRNIYVTPARSVTEKTFILTDEFTIPESQPAAERILSHQVQLLTEDVKAVGTKLIVRGSATLRLLYLSVENTVEAAETATEFSQVIEMEKMPEEPYPIVTMLLSGIYCDLTGSDGRTGETELHLVAQAVVYGTEEAEYLADAYSNSNILELETEQKELRRYKGQTTLHSTLHERLSAAVGAEEIIQTFFEPGSVRMEESEAYLPVCIRVVYRTAEGTVCCVKKNAEAVFRLPAESNRQLIPAGIRVEDMQASPSADGIAIHAEIELRCIVCETEAVSCVSAVRCDADQPLDLSGEPSLVIIQARSGADLWNLAKENRSTVEAITGANNLDTLQEPWEKLILIPKTM